MKVRAKEVGFYKSRRYPGDEFNHPGPCPKWCETADKPVEAKADIPDYEAMSKKDIMTALVDLGATFDSASRRDLLLEQLKGMKGVKK